MLTLRIKALARPSQVATETGVDYFMRDRHGPRSMTLRRWFDYGPLDFTTIAGAFSAVGMTVADMGVLLSAALVAAKKPRYVTDGDFRMEPRPEDLRQLDSLLGRFDKALGTAEEGEFIQHLTNENLAAVREAAQLDYFGRAVEASEGADHWAQIGLLLTVVMVMYQWFSILVWRASFDALVYGASLMLVVLFFIVVLRPRGPVTATLEWARSWADPERKLRTWRGTFWFFVPALIVTIIGTFVVPLLSR